MSAEDFYVPPEVLAGADQEMTLARNVLNDLIKAWQDRQLQFDQAGLTEPLQRLATFMYLDVGTGVGNKHGAATPTVWLFALSIAVTRLAGTQPDPLEGLYEL